MTGRDLSDFSSARSKHGVSAGAIFRRYASFLIIPFLISLVPAKQAWGMPWEASPPTYRKIALNGRNVSDKMPQDIEQTDQEPEETYIDALTLQLRHATTDIFVPLASNLPELMVRRNVQSATWSLNGRLPPERRPDLPFGNCWSSGLAANIHIIEGSPSEPVHVEVTDDQGMVHQFIKVFDARMQLHFCPLPSSNNEQETAAMSLEKKDGNYIFYRKFGTRLVYEDSSKIEIGEAAAKQGESPVKHTYFRLSTIENRAGSRCAYTFYDDNHGIIPDEIAYLTQRIHIERNARGQVVRMIDPQGGDILCEYRDSKLPQGGALLVRLSEQQAVKGGRPVTLYDYDEANEPSGDGQPEFLHCDISRISDPRGKTYLFEYELDRSCAEHGLPRCLRKVSLPDKIGITEFFNYSKRNPDEKQSVRMTYVRDAVGNGRLYRFLENDTVTLDSTNMGKPGAKIHPPQLAVFKRMEISNYQGSNYHVSNKEGFVSDVGMKLLGREECEFDVGTGMGLVKATDLSGNAMHFHYANDYSKPAWMPASPFALHRRDVTEYVNALGAKKHFDYDGETRLLTRAVDENDQVTDYEIDQKRGLIKAIRTYANEDSLKAQHPFTATEYEFNNPRFPAFITKKTIKKIPSANNPPWETDLVVTYEPDVLGLTAREIKNPGGLNLIFRYGYDLNGNKLFAIYPDGYVIQFTYDGRNHLIRVDRPQDNKPPREMGYDLSGNKIRETEPDGTITEMEYDGASRMVKKKVTKKDVAYGTKYFEIIYNAVGSKLYDTTDEGETYTLEYDGLQRTTKMTADDGSKSLFEYGKNCGSDLFESSQIKATRITSSPGQQVIVKEFNANYQKIEVSKTDGTTTSPQISKYEYDLVGNLTLETSPDGGQTCYKYDPLNRLVQTIQPDKKTAETFYTSTGLKFATTDGTAERVEKEFDAAGYVVEHQN